MPLSYEDWAERLFEFFFDEENDGDATTSSAGDAVRVT